MKALIFNEHGTLDNVQVTEIAPPAIKADEVLLKVEAAALNRLDLWVLEGWRGLNLKLPHVMGSDGAGVVAEVGADVTGFKAGDRVAVNPGVYPTAVPAIHLGRENMATGYHILGEHVDGFAGDYVAVPARNLLHLPEHVSFAQAAAASLVYLTAWHSLIKRGQFRASETILIVGAGGGVNTASIQIAKLAGAKTIYVVGSTDEKLAQAEALGADVLINRNKEDWSRAIYKLTNKQGVDVVVDNVGEATFQSSLRALARGGRLLTVGNTSGPMVQIDNRLMFGKHLSIIGSTMGSQQDYEEVMGLVFDGRLTPVIDSVRPLEEGLDALKTLQDGDVMGKLILTP